MKLVPCGLFAEDANRPKVSPRSKTQHSLMKQVTRAGSAGLLLVSLSCGSAAAQGNSPTQLRRFIGEQAGGIG